MAPLQQIVTKKVVVKDRRNLLNTYFHVPEAWQPAQHLGSGTYGTVMAFDISEKRVAVKKVSDVFSDSVKALRTLREIRLLAHLQHRNVLDIQEVFVDRANFKDVYVCLEMMDGDLNRAIQTGSLQDKHCQSILFQISCGLLCLQTACIIHRDLKPGNVLVTKIGVVKLADFGLARSIDDCSVDDGGLTEYVVTRYYRAPEIVLTATEYTYAVDVWSAGCILGEMLLKHPLFKGKDALDQIKKIIGVCGGLKGEDDLCWIPRNSPSSKFIEVCSYQSLHSQDSVWRRLDDAEVNPFAKDILREMLRFNPSSRFSARQILSHKYIEEFGGLDSPDATAACAAVRPDWEFEWDLCYDEYCTPRPLDEALFRSKIMEAQAMVANRSSAALNEEVSSCPIASATACGTNAAVAKDEPRNEVATTTTEVPSGYALGVAAPIAAVRRKMAL